MALFGNKNSIKFFTARVLNIVLNKESLLSEEISKIPKGSFNTIGDIEFSFMGKGVDGNFYAKPFNNHIKYYPLINEIVLVAKLPSKEMYQSEGNDHWYYMHAPINIWKNENHNAAPLIADSFYKQYQKKIDTYLETDSGVSNIERGPADGDLTRDLDISLGNYFRELPKKGLKPFEGDLIVEGRWGNSIRMGSTNRFKENFWSDDVAANGDPITIISNGMNKDPLFYKNNSIEDDSVDSSWIQTTEHINLDPSSIYLTSNQRIRNFKVAGVGNSSFEATHLEEKTETEARNTATDYYQKPKFNKNSFETNTKEDIAANPPTLIQKLSDDFVLDSNLDKASFPERTPFYIIEDTTDDNRITYGQTNINCVIKDPDQDLNLNQPIGEYFKLKHLIYSPKTEDINYNVTSNRHPEAVFERNGVGFYIEINNKGRKTIVTKDLDLEQNFRVLTKKPRINPINSTESDEFKYEKTDTELIREAEAFLFGNHSQYGAVSYPGIDIDIPKTTIIDNLNKLFINCIDPIMKPSGLGALRLNIMSAYRSRQLNSLLPGNPSNSEHIYGHAVDIRLGTGNNQGLFNWCVDNLEFKNLTWAFPERDKNSWIHISYIEGDNVKNTTLISESKKFHDQYNGFRRGPNKNYQDNIKIAKTPPNYV